MEWGGALINLGIGGVGLYLFAQGLLLSRNTVAQILEQLSARIAEWRERYDEMRADRDAWRDLALGNEERLEVAAPTVATLAGAPVPPEFVTHAAPPRAPKRSRAELEADYTAADRALRRRGE